MRKVFLFSCLVLFYVQASTQVMLQNGSALFNLPVHSWQDAKSRLSESISLQYSSGTGLKVDEIASNVGQGWTLAAGGAIIRMQVGQPDDQKPKDGLYNDITKYAPGYLYNPASIGSGCPRGLRQYPIFGSQNVVYKNDNAVDADREQDFFAFSFNGRNGVFVLGKRKPDGTGGAAVFLGDTKLKAWYDIDEAAAASQHLRTTISAFHIQDENGLTYTFKDKGLSKVQRTHSCSVGTNALTQLPYVQATGAPGSYDAGNVYYEAGFDELQDVENPYVVGSWYLSEVKDPLTTRVINYTYHYEWQNTFAGTDIQGVNRIKMIINNPFPQPYVIVSIRYSITKTPILDQISYPDGTSANLIYGADRYDLPGDKQLTAIQVNDKVNDQPRMATRYDLVQSYMIKNEIRQPVWQDEYRLARLCLLGVTRTGADNTGKESQYRFAYNTGTDATENCVPPPFCEVHDIWGYYNGNQHAGVDGNGNPIIPSPFGTVQGRSFTEYGILAYMTGGPNPQTNPNPAVKNGYAALGLLQSVTYPGGGTLTYTYAQNTGLFPGDAAESACGGVHVSQTVSHDGSSSTAADVVTNYSFTMPGNASSMWGLEKAINLRTTNTSFYPESQYVTPIGCDYDYKYPGILSRDQAVSLSDMQKAMGIVSKVLGYGGMAFDIYTILTSAGVNVYVAIAELVIDVVVDFVTTCDQHTTNSLQYIYYSRDLNSTNALPMQFKRAAVSEGTGNGQTVYEFTSPDVPGVPGILVNDNSATYSSRQRSLPWVYGLPRMVTVFDAAGNTLKQTETDYDFSGTTAQRGIDDGTGTNTPSPGSCTCYPVNLSSQGSDLWTTPAYAAMYEGQSTNMNVQPYTLYTGRAPVTDVYERAYKDNSNKLETHTHIDYDPNNYLQQKVTTTLSNGDVSIKETYYAPDYTATGIFATMAANNMVNMPVASYSSIVKNQPCNDCPPNQPIYLGATVMTYGQQPNGDIKPNTASTSWTRVANQLSGVGNFSFDGSNPMNYPNLVTTQSFGYDPTSGNLIRKADEGGRVVTSLYDYNDRFMVAQIANADPGVDKCAYTSFETTGTGAWTVNGSGDWAIASAITGTGGFNFGSHSLSTTVVAGKPYILSFWAHTGAAVSVSGGSLAKTGPTYNGFTYYEYSVAAGSSPTLSGSGVIDELRFYPARARMTTFTYDPVLGKTSECDVNNRISYYEYDPFGRLHIVRDEQSNIIKMYEYNYKH